MEGIMEGFHTRWSICFQSCDDTRLSNLIGSTIIHIHGGKKENITLLCDSRGNSFHDLAIDGLFVVSHKVLVQQLLNLVWRQPVHKSVFVESNANAQLLTSNRYLE
jgi:hypothetical protein